MSLKKLLSVGIIVTAAACSTDKPSTQQNLSMPKVVASPDERTQFFYVEEVVNGVKSECWYDYTFRDFTTNRKVAPPEVLAQAKNEHPYYISSSWVRHGLTSSMNDGFKGGVVTIELMPLSRGANALVSQVLEHDWSFKYDSTYPAVPCKTAAESVAKLTR